MEQTQLDDEDLYCFEEFQIGSKILGEGGFAKVVKGIDTKNNRYIACKIVEIKKLKQHQKVEELFKNEIKLQQSMKSPFIVQLYKVYCDDEKYYLMLEYCENGDLHKYLNKKEPIPEQEVIGFLLQILAGLRELHQKSSIHRDLKPANILINGKQLKIADFGSSRQISKYNQGNSFVGTQTFLAPEIIEGEDYGFEVDIFSLGAMLYYMLFKESPFKGNSDIKMCKSIKEGSISFQKDQIFISRQMQDLLKKLLKYDRKERISWQDIYNHPIVAQNMKNDYVSAEIILAPTRFDIKMYEDPKFSYQKDGYNDQNQFIVPNLEEVQIIKMKPKHINKKQEREQQQLAEQLAEQKKQIDLKKQEVIKKYVHKRNVIETFIFLNSLQYYFIIYFLNTSFLSQLLIQVQQQKQISNIQKMRHKIL